MWDEREPESASGSQGGEAAYFPLGSGKVQPHSIRQIRETGAGGEEKKKNLRVGTDESMGERVTLVGRRSPNKE